jgi:uncharacterized membrane protein HdeD (DUF308 family)
MVRVLINNWWLLLIRGGFAVAFAIFIFFFQPFIPTLFVQALAFTGLAMLFGLFAFVCGVTTMLAALRGAQRKRDLWMLLADGVAVTAGGLAVIVVPGLTLVEVIRIIAGTALVVGIFEIAGGVHLRRHLTDEWLLLAGGVASLGFFAYLMWSGVTEVRSILTWVGVYSLANGAAMAGLAFRLRSLRHSIHALASGEAPPAPGKRPAAV